MGALHEPGEGELAGGLGSVPDPSFLLMQTRHWGWGRDAAGSRVPHGVWETWLGPRAGPGPSSVLAALRTWGVNQWAESLSPLPLLSPNEKC